MSLLSFADVAFFIFIVIRGVLKDFKDLLITLVNYFKFNFTGIIKKSSLKSFVENDNLHYENEEFEKSEKLESIYVSTYLKFILKIKCLQMEQLLTVVCNVLIMKWHIKSIKVGLTGKSVIFLQGCCYYYLNFPALGPKEKL